jgi:hypothetical protein
MKRPMGRGPLPSLMTIYCSNIVNGSTIYTHAPTSIFLRSQNKRNGIRTKALTYIPSVQKVLDLMLNLLSLLGVGPISSSVWQVFSWYQIGLVLNPSNEWQPRRYLSGKTSAYSCKRLVTVEGKVPGELSNENKASLRTKA